MTYATRPVIGITSGLITTDRTRIRVPLPYSEAVIRGGGLPMILPVTERLDLVPELADRIDGLLVSGGPDLDPALYGEDPHPETDPTDPRRTAVELAFLRECEQRRMPILGICGGIQLMNISRGGGLIQHVDAPDRHRTARRIPDPEHVVTIEAGSQLASIVGEDELRVNSSHHQATGRIGRGLVVSARSDDGLVEGLEDPDLPFYIGVQWHPERIIDAPHSVALMEAFVRAAGA